MGFINEARNSIDDKEINNQGGLHVDIHGHAHNIERIELGYRISRLVRYVCMFVYVGVCVGVVYMCVGCTLYDVNCTYKLYDIQCTHTVYSYTHAQHHHRHRHINKHTHVHCTVYIPCTSYTVRRTV